MLGEEGVHVGPVTSQVLDQSGAAGHTYRCHFRDNVQPDDYL